jgi:hypothetical protein
MFAAVAMTMDYRVSHDPGMFRPGFLTGPWWNILTVEARGSVQNRCETFSIPAVPGEQSGLAGVDHRLAKMPLVNLEQNLGLVT